jgi:hypothetical protein
LPGIHKALGFENQGLTKKKKKKKEKKKKGINWVLRTFFSHWHKEYYIESVEKILLTQFSFVVNKILNYNNANSLGSQLLEPPIDKAQKT